jgi:hypothetical protein
MREMDFPIVTKQKPLGWTPFWRRPQVMLWLRDGAIGAGVFVALWYFFG